MTWLVSGRLRILLVTSIVVELFFNDCQNHHNCKLISMVDSYTLRNGKGVSKTGVSEGLNTVHYWSQGGGLPHSSGGSFNLLLGESAGRPQNNFSQTFNALLETRLDILAEIIYQTLMLTDLLSDDRHFLLELIFATRSF